MKSSNLFRIAYAVVAVAILCLAGLSQHHDTVSAQGTPAATAQTSSVDLSTVPCAAMAATPEPSATAAATMAASTDNGCLLAGVFSGAEETLSGDLKGSGVAFISVDPSTGTVCYKISVTGITLPAVGDHIHGGAKGQDGDVLIPFSTVPDKSGLTEACVQADAGLVGKVVNDPADYYVNIHTKNFRAGAMRGQLQSPLAGDLTGANETPAGATAGSGTAFIVMNDTSLCYLLNVTGITLPAKKAQIQAGASGQNGDVVVTFPTAPDQNGYAIGCATKLKAGVTSDILANPDQYYVNILTSDFKSGAVRGQLH